MWPLFDGSLLGMAASSAASLPPCKARRTGTLLDSVAPWAGLVIASRAVLVGRFFDGVVLMNVGVAIAATIMATASTGRAMSHFGRPPSLVRRRTMRHHANTMM